MKISSILIVLLFCVNVNAGEPDKVLHEKCLYPTVMLVNNSHVTEMNGAGTGVIVKSVKKDKKWENYVLTVGHVLSKTPKHLCHRNGPDEPPILEEEKYEYIARVGVYKDWSTLVEIKDYECKILYDCDEKDIALVKFISNKQMPTAEIAVKMKVYLGNEVVRVGCGIGEPFRLDYGRITSLPLSTGRRSEKLNDTLRISAPTIQGDSGGPVYQDGKLIALAEAIAGTSIGPMPVPVYHIVYAVPIKRVMDCEEITKYLKEEK